MDFLEDFDATLVTTCLKSLEAVMRQSMSYGVLQDAADWLKRESVNVKNIIR